MTRIRASDAAATAALIGAGILLLGLAVKAFMALGRQAGGLNAVAGLLGIFLVAAGVSEPQLYRAAPLFLLGLALCAVPVMGVVHRGRVRAEAKRVLAERLETVVRQHLSTLRLRRSQLIVVDHYGVPQRGKWEKELRRFFDDVVMPALVTVDPAAPSKEYFPHVAGYIEAVIAEAPVPAPATRPQAMDPGAFETHCAELIQACGWNARTTGGSGDQGIDVIAERNGVKIVFQCKLYSRPVGNSAVQEIAAGRAFERATFAAVLSNQTYTPGAQELAKANKVQLLHPDQLGAYLKKVDAWVAQRQAAAAA